jgi:hypothetical protein
MKKVLYILIFTIITSSAMAQGSFMSWQYSMGFSTGDLKTYTSPASFRGFTYNYHRLVKDNVAMGMEIGWNVFYEAKPFDTYSYKNIDYSGKQWRYSNNVPLLFTVGYFDMSNEITPFVDLGIGTMYSERRTTFGQYSFIQDGWHFELKPEVGIMYNTGGASLAISGKYYYGFKAGDLPAEGYFTINVGFVIRVQ